MKKVLVTGASGFIGLEVLKFLLSESKYEITALDFKSKEANKKLKAFRKEINIIYGDICDPTLMDALVKEHDYIIHLAGIMPPLCNLNKTFGEKIDFVGTENIVRAIHFYHPECFLIYPSTTTLYEKAGSSISVNSKKGYSLNDYYSEIKENCENLIKKKIKNWCIFRIPFVLGDLHSNPSIFFYQKGEEIETITNSDVAYAFVKAIEQQEALNKKIKILSGGKNCRITKEELLCKIYDYYGFSFRMLWNRFLNSYTYVGNTFKEDKKLNELLHYQNDSIDSFFERVQAENKRLLHPKISQYLKKRIERQKKL